MFIGIFITLEPAIFGVDMPPPDPNTTQTAWYFPLLFTLSWLPLALSLVIIEKDQHGQEVSKTILAHLLGAYALTQVLSIIRFTLCAVCPPLLPEIIKMSNPYLLQRFFMFLDYVSYVLVAPPISHTIMAQKPYFHIFFFFSEIVSRWHTSYYTRRFLKFRP